MNLHQPETLSVKRRYRQGLLVALGTALLLFWINAGVGLIGSADNPYNRWYDFILVAGLLGGLATRFRPRGLAFILYLLAGLQLLITAVLVLTGLGWRAFPWNGIGLTFFFAALWILSGRLFLRASANRV